MRPPCARGARTRMLDCNVPFASARVMPDEHSTLTALSPLDGRYRSKVEALSEHFSEYALIRQRVRVELGWLVALGDEAGIAEVPPFPAAAKSEIAQVA